MPTFLLPNTDALEDAEGTARSLLSEAGPLPAR